MIRDLTKGSVWRHIIVLSVTTFLGLAIQQFYSLADTIIVGRVLGQQPLAGVGATTSLNFMIILFSIGLCNGCGISIAREFGAGDYVKMRKYAANSIWMCIGFGAFITIITAFLTRTFLVWLSTPTDILDFADEYATIVFVGVFATIFYNLLATFIRSLGDTKTPLAALIISSIINIGLDFVLMVWIPMGVAGAALATVIAQALSGVFCLIVLIKKFDIMKFRREELKAEKPYLKQLVSYGIPMGLQFSITAIGLLILQSAVNGFGSIAVTGMTVGGKVNALFHCPIDGLGSIMTPFTSQNLGAKQYARIKEGLYKAILIGFAWSLLIIPVVFLFGRPMVGLFINNPSPEIIDYAFTAIRCTSCFLVLLTLVNPIRYTIQGMGYTSFAMIAGVMEMIGRIIAAILFTSWFGFTGAAFAHTFAWILADAFLVPAFYSCFKKVQQKSFNG